MKLKVKGWRRMKVYNKLVRDKIPEVIQASGGHPVTRILDDREFYRELLSKLKEEVNEFLESEEPEEIADIYEVLDAIICFRGVRAEEIRTLQNQKRLDRGGFNQRIFLNGVEEKE